MVPKRFLQAYFRMLHLKKKIRRDGYDPTNITNKQAGKKQTMHPTRQMRF